MNHGHITITLGYIDTAIHYWQIRVIENKTESTFRTVTKWSSGKLNIESCTKSITVTWFSGNTHFTLGYQKCLHPMGSREVASWKTSDNRRTIAGFKMVPKLGARWGPTICSPKFQNDFKATSTPFHSYFRLWLILLKRHISLCFSISTCLFRWY